MTAETQVVVTETQHLVAGTHITTTETRDAVSEMQSVLKTMSSEITAMYQGLSLSSLAMQNRLLTCLHVNRAFADAACRATVLLCEH